MGTPCVMHMPQAGPGLRRADKQGTVPVIRVTQVSMHPARAWAGPGPRESVPQESVELGLQDAGISLAARDTGGERRGGDC